MPHVVTGWLFPFRTPRLAIKVAFTLDDFGNLHDLAIGRSHQKTVDRCLRRHSRRFP